MRLLILIPLFLCSCGRYCAEPTSMQCFNNSIYVCNTNNKWELIQTCKPGSTCEYEDDLAYCTKNLKEAVDAGTH